MHNTFQHLKEAVTSLSYVLVKSLESYIKDFLCLIMFITFSK